MSRVNHNANYIYDVDGETVWEKLRTIRGMLDDRKRAYQHSLLGVEAAKSLDKNSMKYKKYLIDKDFHDGLIKDCENEIKFLTEFEAYLAKEAEKTRIPGKTDDEMYEINFYDELKVRLIRRAQTQIISTGRIEVETLGRILKMPEALQLCIKTGLLSKDILEFTNTPQLPNNDLTQNYLALEKKG